MNKFFILFISSFYLNAQNFYSLCKTNESEVVIDGIIEDKEWLGAQIIPLNIEIEPANNSKSKKKTITYLKYSDEALLIGINAYDNPKNIRASIRSRDSKGFWRDDVLQIRIDTYRDARNNYVLAVNPLGSQFDLLLNNILGRKAFDSNFNINFQSAGRILDNGYQVEVKIPFSELPFPNNINQIWNIRLFRSYYQDGIRIQTSSQETDRDNLCEVCQTTDAIQMKNIKIEKRQEILPYVFSSLSGEKQNNNSTIEYENIFSRVGFGINYDFSKTTLFEASINPDFSQVEADVTLIDVNSPVSLQYPERRPFFNRGTDIVNFSQDIYYSRSISSPSFASKLLNQGKKSRFFLLTAMDDYSKYLIGGEDKSISTTLGESYSGLFRYQKVLNNSRLGLVSANRIYQGGGHGTLIGIDGIIDLNNTWRFSFELFKNFNSEPISDKINSVESRYGRSLNLDGETFQGHSSFIKISRISEHFRNIIYYSEVSPNHQSDLGIITRTNRKFISFTNTYNNIINRDFVREFSFALDTDILKNFRNELNLISINLKGSISFYGNSYLEYNYDIDTFKNYLDLDFENLGIHEIEFRSNPSEVINLTGLLSWGRDLSYNESIPEVGNLFTSNISIRFQLNNNLSISPSIRTSELNEKDGTKFFKGTISRLRLNYQINNFLNLRLVAENNTFNERFFIQPLIQWNPNPATIFYLGSNQQSVSFEDEFLNQPDLISFNRSQFFMKFQYLIGI